MFHFYNSLSMSNNRKLQYLLESKLSTDDKVPRAGRLLRNKIFVIGFPPNCTELDLETFFSNFGLVRETRIVKDDNGVTKGFAFITFAKERSVVNALEYRGPLYFMDRKLSINPAIKKQYPLIQSDRCHSSPASTDTPSDASTTTTRSNTMASPGVPLATSHHYYNAPCQPFFHVRFPSHPVYCNSTFPSLWHPYYPPGASYAPTSCNYLPLTHGNDGYPIRSTMPGMNIYPTSMMRYGHGPPANSKLVS